jgi:UDP-N-acetylmuramate dehydrogenase
MAAAPVALPERYADLGALPGVKLLPREPLSKHTYLRVGGPADVLAVPRDEDALVALLAACEAHVWSTFMLGLGSNLLVRDGGIRAVVIRLGAGFRMVRHEGTSLIAGAAAPLPTVSMYCVENGLAGMEWAAGIPGTVGGGLVMNAGAHDEDMSMWVASARFVRASGERLTRTHDEIVWRYRETDLPPKAIPVEVTLALQATDPDTVRAARAALLAHRNATQPVGVPSCGSTFRNPPGHHAGRLIEAAGLKGHRIGGVEVSTKHANFFLTSPGARAADVLALIHHVQDVVRSRFGVELVPEVKVVGEDEGSVS